MKQDELSAPGEPADVLTHGELVEQGNRLAATLTSYGVTTGSRVAALLPMCLESVVVTLACLRLGALRITLPLGDHTGWVRHRIRSSGARVVITADSHAEDDAVLPVKAALDQALAGCPDVHTVLVVPQLPRPVPWQPGRDRWWHDALTPPVGTAPYPVGMTSSRPEQPGSPDPEPYWPAAQPAPPRSAGLIFDDPLVSRAADDRDEGWGDAPAPQGAADLARFLDEKPPHHV